MLKKFYRAYDSAVEKIPRKEVKVKAHAFTMAAVLMLFLLPFGLFGIFSGLHYGKIGHLWVGVIIVVVHALLIWRALHHWRHEKKKSAIWIEGEAGID